MRRTGLSRAGPDAPDRAEPGGPDARGPAELDGLYGRVALVTGGSGGIGRALCQRLAAAGTAVAVGYGQHVQAATDMAAGIIAAGGRAAAVGGDLGDPAGPADLVRAAEDALGPVDVLVSNAGMGGTKTLAEVTAADFTSWPAATPRPGSR